MNSRNNSLRTAFLGLAAVSLVVACNTIVPDKTKPSQASFDSNGQTSGFVGWTHGGAIITTHARDRYNGLVDTYAGKFIPPLKHDDGITPDGTNYTITSQALANFATMNRWRKEKK